SKGAGAVDRHAEGKPAGKAHRLQPTGAVVAEAGRVAVGRVEGGQFPGGVRVGDGQSVRINRPRFLSRGVEVGTELVLGGVGEGAVAVRHQLSEVVGRARVGPAAGEEAA